MSNRFARRMAWLLFLGAASLSAASNSLTSGPGPDRWTGDLSPISKADWNYQRAGYLLDRAGFSGTPDDVRKLAAMSPADAVNYLVDYEGIDTSSLPKFEESGIFDPDMIPDVERRYSTVVETMPIAIRRGEMFGVHEKPDGPLPFQPVTNQIFYRFIANGAEWVRASLWWGNRMLRTPRPMEEKLSLFWHGHFATEDKKVMDYRIMLGQLETIRRNANGNFRTLLLSMAKDPAMLVYLDNRLNVKGHANENFAREVMELFALGAGNYTETDIKEVARSLTGWTEEHSRFVFKPESHDDGTKTVLGQNGNFDGEQVIDIILKQKAAPLFISRKLYRYLVREDLSPQLNAQLAALLLKSNWEMKPLLKTMLLSKDFYSSASYGSQVKSPVFLLVSTYRKMGLTEIPGVPNFVAVTSALGQTLGNPPNVKGWDGGMSWLNPATLLDRANVARDMLFPQALLARAIPDLPADVAEAEKAANMKGPAAGGMMAAPEPKSAYGEIKKTERYNVIAGSVNGHRAANRRVKRMPRTAATVDFAAMLKGAQAGSAEQVVDYMALRFLRLPLDSADRALFIDFVKKRAGEKIDFTSSNLENTLRELVHLIMSTPEYQLT